MSETKSTASRMLWWFAGCVAGGWLIVYNVLRLGGDAPNAAALPALVVGGSAGVVIFALGLTVVRRLAASGRVIMRPAVSIPDAEKLDQPQRDALRMAAPLLAMAAAVALVVGVFAGLHWLDSRSASTALLALWFLAFGAWVADEAWRVWRGLPDGLESVVFGCLLTCVLGGVAISRDLVRPGQVVLIVASGLAAAALAGALWRLTGSRGVPVGIGVAVVVATASLAIPLLG
jgi:hypothetical protein